MLPNNVQKVLCVQNEKTKDNVPGGRNALLVVVFALIIIVVGAGSYWMGLAPFPEGNGGEAVDSLQSPQAVALLGALEKQQNVSQKYVLEFSLDDLYGYGTMVRIERNGDSGMVLHKGSIYDERYYFEEGSEFLCVNFPGEGQKCTGVSPGGELKNRTTQLRQEFLFAPEGAAEDMRRLIKGGKIVFKKNATGAVVAGRACTNISYEYVDAGYVVKIERCFDDEFGIALRSSDTYLVGGESATYSAQYSFFEVPQELVINMPEENSDEARVGELLASGNSVSMQAAQCIGDVGDAGAYDKCIFRVAFDAKDARICMASKDEQGMQSCITRLVVATGTPEYCARAEAGKDNCYLEYAYAKKDRSYCTVITNSSMREECVGAIEAPPPVAAEGN
ncbi:hypothetical protein COU37_05980 [Candidatus Micrarchaeota archaeon CG10_big_fil_rev_8_21_14_0_10_45_29]|nr:MAG: hypothetical protein COU37_05980 [Candidatus Micrarchaeota archaeon CG10_big_fil_rev_8_21_14_0_10_45_29]